jgi:DNA-binding CsgD family transcriptional regulator
VLALTTFDEDEVLAGMLRAGAAGFVLKGVPAEDLQRAVRVVADGGAWLDPAITARVLAIYRSVPAPAAGPDAESARAGLAALTSREREVLVLIGHGRTNGEIAAGLFVSEGTVKTHINHLFTKLRLRDRAAAVVFAFDHDLVTRELPGMSGVCRSSYIVPAWHGLSQANSWTASRASGWLQERAGRRNCPVGTRWPGWSTRTRTRPLPGMSTVRSCRTASTGPRA